MAAKSICCPNDIHEHPFYCNRTIRDYHRLEKTRIHRLKLEPRYSRLYDVTRNDPPAPILYEGLRKCRDTTMLPQYWDNLYDLRAQFDKMNVWLPFSTIQRNVCGPWFSWETDNRKKKWKLPRGYLMPKWRPLADYTQYS